MPNDGPRSSGLDFMSAARRNFSDVIESLNGLDIMRKPTHTFSAPFDFGDDLLGGSSKKLFLGDYTHEELEEDIEKYGIKAGLAERGYTNIILSTDTSDYYVHKVSITDKTLLDDPSITLANGKFLIDMYIRKREFVVSDFKTYQLMRRLETDRNVKDQDPQMKKIKYIDSCGASQISKVLENELKDKYMISLIEWLCMQDPHQYFEPHRPQFPGQSYPGLHLGKRFGVMLVDLATSKGREALCDVPEHFHNACIYNDQGYRFINPAFQAYFDCLCESLAPDLARHGLAAVSWAFCTGHVRNAEDETEIWSPEEQMYPISPRLCAFYDSPEYKRLYNTYYKRGYTVHINWQNAKEIWIYSLDLSLSDKENSCDEGGSIDKYSSGKSDDSSTPSGKL